MRPLPLTYHEVDASPSPYIYSVSEDQFAGHARALASEGAVFTFDDGLRSHLHRAAPILEENRARGLFFVTAGWTENRPEYMNWQELRELSARGHEVQAHGWSHKFLTHCPEAQLKEELERPKKALEDGIGCAVDAISAPGGRWNRSVVRACAAAGYKRLYTSVPWHPHVHEDAIQVIGRIMVRRTMDLAALRRLLHMSRRDRAIARLIYGAKSGVRMVFGDRLYGLAWNVLGRKSSSDYDQA
jgi:peptidoglycan/xylan/chitin deacetylase (PgdA/CDA1 family)